MYMKINYDKVVFFQVKIRKIGSTSWTTSSDSRIKLNIQEADYDLCYSNVKS